MILNPWKLKFGRSELFFDLSLLIGLSLREYSSSSAISKLSDMISTLSCNCSLWESDSIVDWPVAILVDIECPLENLVHVSWQPLNSASVAEHSLTRSISADHLHSQQRSVDGWTVHSAADYSSWNIESTFKKCNSFMVLSIQ